MTLLVVTDNQISERKAEVAELEAARTPPPKRGRPSSPPTPSSATSATSASPTVTSLADSRFDWERVMRELALILPDDVWLTNLTGTVNPEVAVNGGASVALRGSVPGPALETDRLRRPARRRSPASSPR